MQSALEAQIKDITTLNKLQQFCETCLSSEIRSDEKLVFGEGPPQAEIMIIGEAPGAQEAKTGRPFVGSAGKLLTKLLNEIGLRREQIYIGNVLKTRPPGNRKPYRGEIKKEFPFLNRQIELIQPKLLVLLGATALQALTSPETKLTRLRGSWIEIGGIPALITYHPAAALRDKAKEAVLKQDFIALRDYLASGA